MDDLPHSERIVIDGTTNKAKRVIVPTKEHEAPTWDSPYDDAQEQDPANAAKPKKPSKTADEHDLAGKGISVSREALVAQRKATPFTHIVKESRKNPAPMPLPSFPGNKKK